MESEDLGLLVLLAQLAESCQASNFPICKMEAIQCYRDVWELFVSWSTHICMYMYVPMYLSKHTYMNVNPYVPQHGETVSTSNILSHLSHTHAPELALAPSYLPSISLPSSSRLKGMPPPPRLRVSSSLTSSK